MVVLLAIYCNEHEGTTAAITLVRISKPEQLLLLQAVVAVVKAGLAVVAAVFGGQ